MALWSSSTFFGEKWLWNCGISTGHGLKWPHVDIDDIDVGNMIVMILQNRWSTKMDHPWVPFYGLLGDYSPNPGESGDGKRRIPIIFPLYTSKFIHPILYPLYIHSDPIRIPFIFHQHSIHIPYMFMICFHYITFLLVKSQFLLYKNYIPLLYSNEVVIVHPDSHHSIQIAVRSHSCSVNSPWIFHWCSII